MYVYFHRETIFYTYYQEQKRALSISKKEGFVPATVLTIPCAMRHVMLRSACIFARMEGEEEGWGEGFAVLTGPHREKRCGVQCNTLTRRASSSKKGRIRRKPRMVGSRSKRRFTLASPPNSTAPQSTAPETAPDFPQKYFSAYQETASSRIAGAAIPWKNQISRRFWNP